MAVAEDQNVPAELQDLYDAALYHKPWLLGKGLVGHRIPFRIPTLQGCRTIRPPIKRGSQVSDPMCINRHVFGDCIKCFNKQPYHGGVEPDGIGPYSRTWWFTETIGILPWYFNYFIRKTMEKFLVNNPPNWCSISNNSSGWVHLAFPNAINCNGTSLWFAWHVGEEAIMYIHKDDPAYKTLWLHKHAIGDQEGLGEKPLIICVYDVPDEWTCNTLSWNNKPALGKAISIRYIWNTTPNWYRFYTGNSMRIAIKCLKYNWFGWFYGVTYADANKRPRWTS